MTIFRLFNLVAKVVAQREAIQAAVAGDVIPVGESKVGKVFGRAITLIVTARVD